MGFSMSTCCSDFASLWALPCNFPSLSALPCNFPSHWVLPCIFVEYVFFSLALFPPSQHAGFSFHTKLQFQYVRDDLASGSKPANIPHIPGCHDTAHGKQLVPRGTHPLGTPGKDCARFASGGFHAFRFPDQNEGPSMLDQSSHCGIAGPGYQHTVAGAHAQAIDGNHPILAMCHWEPHEACECRPACAGIGAISQPD